MSFNISAAELDKLFEHHPPTGTQRERYQRIRSSARAFANTIIDCAPHCADRTAAIRKVREAMMTANAAIALED